MRARTNNWLVHVPGAVDRIEARFSGLAFSPHRHDRYAIGITLGGVQSFDDRGVTLRGRALPGLGRARPLTMRRGTQVRGS